MLLVTVTSHHGIKTHTRIVSVNLSEQAIIFDRAGCRYLMYFNEIQKVDLIEC